MEKGNYDKVSINASGCSIKGRLKELSDMVSKISSGNSLVLSICIQITTQICWDIRLFLSCTVFSLRMVVHVTV